MLICKAGNTFKILIFGYMLSDMNGELQLGMVTSRSFICLSSVYETWFMIDDSWMRQLYMFVQCTFNSQKIIGKLRLALAA